MKLARTKAEPEQETWFLSKFSLGGSVGVIRPGTTFDENAEPGPLWRARAWVNRRLGLSEPELPVIKRTVLAVNLKEWTVTFQ